jgi:Heparinase II/III-like protein
MSPVLAEYDPDLVETLRRAEKQKKWLVQPDLTIVALGDSEPKLRSDVKIPLGSPHCQSVLSYSEDPSCYLLRHFDEVGYVIARSDWAIPVEGASMLFVQGGFFKRTHRHADDFSFEWFERGRKILSDSGKFGYTRDNWEAYFESTRAHNTVEVDGLDHSINPNDAYGDATKTARMTSGGIRIILQVHHGDLGFWHRRQIDYRPGEELRIKDAVRSDRVGDYIQWHHFARAFELSGDAGRFEIDDGEMLVELTTSTSCGDDAEYMMIRGQREPRLQGWASVAERERHPRWALGVACEARNATFEARYELM